jgi:hemerythrin
MATSDVLEYQWVESMRTGIDTVDIQHKELIRQMNLLMRAMARGEGASQIDSLMQYLMVYAGQHFRHEEECMEQYRCPVAQANQAAHARFVKRFTAFHQQLVSAPTDNSLVTIQVLRELSAWLINHIRGVDARLLCSVEATPPR